MKFTGRVVHGANVGEHFGVATANLELDQEISLDEGVYFVRTRVLQNPGSEYNALLHYGHRKTFGGEFSIEVHILDFKQDLYNQKLEVEVLHRERDVRKFDNADALFTQIEQDKVRAQKFFLRRKIAQHWRDISDEERRKLDEQAVELLEQNEFFLKATRVFAFAPMRDELHFVQKMCSIFPDKDYFWPKVEHDKIHFFLDTFENLKLGAFNIREPKVAFEAIPRTQDVVIVPALAADEWGYRLGRGKGYYDRFLATTKSHSITLLPYFAISPKKIPTEPHDQMIDEVLVIKK
ncbi:5-formyltetrahydrofolate cyclo-ligase [Candidatus Gracilibacteria bacterium]|nr:5-formyltetrahydrofolate cyclo-ligase [Candidatus Gracilibacteria bacterium]